MKTIAKTQSFEDFNQYNYIYIDKTENIYQLLQERKIFISRPRRFGKSLMLNTIGTLFEHGVDPYFKNTWIYDKWNEQKYLVLRLDFLAMSCIDYNKFCKDFDDQIVEFAELNNLKYVSKNFPDQSIKSLFSTINKINKKNNTQNQIVILIDEYDAQLSANINNPRLYETFRISIREFYAALKRSTSIRFLGITGVTRLKDVSIFSAGSDINDLSYHTSYSTIIGFTRDEIRKYYIDYINLTVSLIHKIPEEQVTEDQRNKFLDQLAAEYAGYCFDDEYINKVYSTWSVNNFFDKVATTKEVYYEDFWYDNGGTPSILKNYLKTLTIKFDNYIEDIDLDADDFLYPRSLLEMKQETLMCQTGYLTLHSTISGGAIKLGLPNNEIYRALLKQLSQKIFPINSLLSTDNKALFSKATADEIVKKLNELMNSINYEEYQNATEKTIQGFIHTFMIGADQNVITEHHSALGRSDIVIEYDNRRLVFELKYAKTSSDCENKLQEAINQIQNKKYGDVLPNKELLKIALVFNGDKTVRQFTHYKEVK